jgi:hypothetical protein
MSRGGKAGADAALPRRSFFISVNQKQTRPEKNAVSVPNSCPGKKRRFLYIQPAASAEMPALFLKMKILYSV